MKDLSRHQCSYIAGGDPGMVLAGGGAFGGGGSSFGSGGINFGGSVGSGFESAVGGGGFELWEGSGGFESSAVTGLWSVDAIMGQNVFFVNGVLMLAVKVVTMAICWMCAIFIAPVGLAYLYYHHSKVAR